MEDDGEVWRALMKQTINDKLLMAPYRRDCPAVNEENYGGGYGGEWHSLKE